jgi:hypothetical protein
MLQRPAGVQRPESARRRGCDSRTEAEQMGARSNAFFAVPQAEREAWRQKLLERMFYLYREELDDRLGGESDAQYAGFLREIS